MWLYLTLYARVFKTEYKNKAILLKSLKCALKRKIRGAKRK